MKRLMLLGMAIVVAGCAQQPTGKGPETAPRTEKGPVGRAYQPPEPVNPKDPVILIDTSMGPIKVELFDDKAPITVKNFLSYVDDKFYDGTIFHRVMGRENSGRDFMIQGGGFEPSMKQKKPNAPIKNEADNGLSNRRGTLAMARTNDPDSATSQFFISVADNRKSLDRSPGNFGYAVFGQVLEGMDVVDRIKAVRTGPRGGHGDVPLEDVMIKSVRRVEK
jgi:cyclophilin family peptidyl-prolyl cis-trans isomerase